MDDSFLARTLRETRNMAGISQEKIAWEMGIARKTVQNWEKGVSAPSIQQAMDWFRILEISPLPYLFQFVYPKFEKISSKDDDQRLRDALLTLISELPPEGMRQLLYLFYADHGTSPRVVMNLMTAYLQSPMRDKVMDAHVILKHYELAEITKQLVSEEHIGPDVALLRTYIEKCEAELSQKET